MKSHCQQIGFTLIELIIVIFILGILSVVAVPKFIDISSEAKSATLHALKGSMEDTSTLVNAKAILEGKDKMESSVLQSGLSLIFGYPAAFLAVPFREAFGLGVDQWEHLPNGNTATIRHKGSTNVNCQITYTRPFVPGNRPEITIDDSGC